MGPGIAFDARQMVHDDAPSGRSGRIRRRLSDGFDSPINALFHYAVFYYAELP